MSIPNPKDIYPDASEGRLKTAETSVREESKIITKDVEGSEEFERTKEYQRRNTSVRLDDRLRVFIIVCGTLIGAFGFINSQSRGITRFFEPLVIIPAIVLISFLVYYLVRQISIAKKSRDFRKKRKDPNNNNPD